ncbi:MAG TPA: SLBB domain-containing protein, partial [Ignavibacteria bacterium]|nr:SLBB domain-containing protein [Ignavibacteria bacterium]
MKTKFLPAIVMLLLFAAMNTYGQINQSSNQTSTYNPNSNQGLFNMKINADSPELMSQFNTQNVQQKTFPVDKAVNPDYYTVGPNDMFNLGIFGYMNQTIPLVVTLEGSLVIPTVGEVKVNGLTLSDAKRKVVNAVKKRYYSSDVSLTLSMPRIFLVTVYSSIQSKMEVTPLTRASEIVSRVYYDTLDVSQISYKINNEKNEFVPQMSLRNIEIIHKNGTTDIADLYRYFSTNEDKYNPYLQEGDLIKIPFGLINKNYVTVEGAVQLGGTYEYNKDDNLESVISLGRGFDTDAEPDSITVFRSDPVTRKYKSIDLSFEKDKNFKINVFDRVFVKYKANTVMNLSVMVLGEINRPGVYPIAQKSTTLKEIIEMAGGMKPTAFLPLCILFRKYDNEYTRNDTAEVFLNRRANDLIVQTMDKDNFEVDVLSRRNRVVVDFEKLFKENDLSQNVILEHKDVVYINDDKKIVYVYGQVSNEGYVPFKEGENYEYYIKKAGGYSLAADDGDTRIVRFNSRGWYKADETKVQSGDFIYVPKVVKTKFGDKITLIATILGSLVSILTTYILIKNTN